MRECNQRRRGQGGLTQTCDGHWKAHKFQDDNGPTQTLVSWAGHRPIVSGARGIGGAWSGELIVACHRQACSGSTSCNRRIVSRSHRLLAIAPSTVSAHPGDHFPSCTPGSTPRPSEDAELFQRSLSAAIAPPIYTNSIFVFIPGRLH